jgi:TolB-like protein/TPR repeat protein
MERRLAAILAADVVGYSRLMEADEEGTLRLLSAYREIIDGLIADHRGRVFGSAGDSVIAEFASPVEAMRCAVKIQQELESRNGNLAQDRRMQFRIGVNLGDVVAENENLHGDGVNIAARLEELAEPGGVCVSGTVYDHLAGKLDIVLDDLGEQKLKNIARPVRVWRWAGEDTAQSRDIHPALPDKPSIAVLPFTNMSGDPDQEYFSDGITEDIITEISRFQDLFVIARNSSFSYKGKAENVQKIATELGARYVLEGGVRTAGKRIRITTQLIDAESGHHLWAERYDRDLADVFELQDEISQRVASTVVGRLRVTAQERAQRKRPENLEAYDYLLRGRSIAGDTEDNNLLAKRAYEKAIELDPTCARAYMGLSQHHIIDGFSNWGESPERSRELALECAVKAASLDKYDSEVQWRVGFVYTNRGEFEEARVYLERAIELNPNDADALTVMGVYLTAIGEHEDAVVFCEKAMQLNPFCPGYYLWNLAGAYHAARRYADVLGPMQEYVSRNPKFMNPRRVLAAAYARLGRMEEAKREVDTILTAQPDASLKDIKKRAARLWKKTSDLEHYIESLRMAGFPE